MKKNSSASFWVWFALLFQFLISSPFSYALPMEEGKISLSLLSKEETRDSPERKRVRKEEEPSQGGFNRVLFLGEEHEPERGALLLTEGEQRESDSESLEEILKKEEAYYHQGEKIAADCRAWLQKNKFSEEYLQVERGLFLFEQFSKHTLSAAYARKAGDQQAVDGFLIKAREYQEQFDSPLSSE